MPICKATQKSPINPVSDKVLDSRVNVGASVCVGTANKQLLFRPVSQDHF